MRPKPLTKTERNLLYWLRLRPVLPRNKKERKALDKMQNRGWLVLNDDGSYELTDDFRCDRSGEAELNKAEVT